MHPLTCSSSRNIPYLNNKLIVNCIPTTFYIVIDITVDVSVGVPMIDRFCVVFRFLFVFDVKLRNFKYSLNIFKAYSLTISTNTKK